MSAPIATVESSPSGRRRRRKLWLLLGLVTSGPIAAAWWLTEPLTDRPALSAPSTSEVTRAADHVDDPETIWPESRLTGDEAKKLLLASNERSVRQLERMTGYTATFRKQERVSGQLGPEQTLAMKVRNQPFAIYLKFLAPKAGKEVVYAQGHHDNKVIAHNGDWTRRIVPRLAVPPDSALALADTRHPVTEAGLVHLSKKLLHYRKLDIGDPAAVTILDRTTGADGRPRLRSVHTHSNRDGRPFARVEILYDPATQYPIEISSYDWPESGDTGDLELAEKYAYDEVRFDANLTASDFDPKNPDYAFMRF